MTRSLYKDNQEMNHFFKRNDSISLEQLKNFIAVYELGSLSSAAEATYKTQPAVSHNLNKLEEKLNAQLIVRNRGKSISITEEGHRFYHEISPLIDKLLTRIDEVENKNAITIGVPDDLDMSTQLSLYQQISANIDNRLRFICGFSKDIRKMVEEGRISFGIIKESASNGNLRYGWAANKKAVFSEYNKIPLVVGYKGCIIRDLVESTLNKVDKDFFVVYVSNRIFHRVEAVKAGFGIGVFSNTRIQETPELIRVTEQDGFPALKGFDYKIIGNVDTAQKAKIKPILEICIKQLDKSAID